MNHLVISDCTANTCAHRAHKESENKWKRMIFQFEPFRTIPDATVMYLEVNDGSNTAKKYFLKGINTVTSSSSSS